MNILKVILALGFALFLVQFPGNISFSWLGMEIETSMAVFFIALLLILLFLYLLLSLLRLPKRLKMYWQRRKHEKGIESAWKGLSAIAGQEWDEADALAKVAQRYAPENPLGIVVAGQAAYLSGKMEEALKHFQNLETHKTTEFLGLRGQTLLAMQANDWISAQKFLTRAVKIRPHSPWALKHLLEASFRTGQLTDSEKTLKKLQQQGFITKNEMQNHQGLLFWFKAENALNQKNFHRFSHFAQKAHEWLPQNVEIAIQLAEVQHQLGETRKAQRVLSQTWAHQPHPQIISQMKKVLEDISPLALYRKLLDFSENVTLPETQLYLGGAALEAQLWGPAYQHLETFHKAKETRHSCRLMGDLLVKESPEAREKAEVWYQKSLSASSDAQWIYQNCQTVHISWWALCPSCGGFDTIAWGYPQQTKQAILFPGALSL